MYALDDDEEAMQALLDDASNFQAIKKPKIFADEQFKYNIACMMKQSKDIQD